MQGEVKNAVAKANIILTDDLTGNELAGAVISIYDDDNNLVASFTTSDTDGEGYEVSGLTPGKTYHIVEESPRTGYTNTILIPTSMNGVLQKKTANEVTFVMDDVTVNSSLTNVPDNKMIQIENAFVTGTFFIDKNGVALTSATRQESERYYFGNIVPWVKTQFGYSAKKLSGAEFSVYAKEDIFHPDGKTGIIYHKGDLVKTNVRTTKEDAVLTTNASGCTGFWNLYLGIYEVRETNIPAGYIRNLNNETVELSYKDAATQMVTAESDVVFSNERQKVHLTVTKRDKENTTIQVAGAVFGLYAKEPILAEDGSVLVTANTLVETAETGEDGVAVMSVFSPHRKRQRQWNPLPTPSITPSTATS